MHHRTKRLVAGAVTAAVITTGGATIAAASGDDQEQPLTGDALQRASEAALAHTGGGRVTESEAGDSGGAFEAEILLDDGSQVEVWLDEEFNVLGSGADNDGSGDDDR
jgi:hypothetical protein